MSACTLQQYYFLSDIWLKSPFYYYSFSMTIQTGYSSHSIEE